MNYPGGIKSSVYEHLQRHAENGDANCQAILDSWGKAGKEYDTNRVSAYIKKRGLPNLPAIDPEAEAEVIAEQKKEGRYIEPNTEHDEIDVEPVPESVKSIPASLGGWQDKVEQRRKELVAWDNERKTKGQNNE